MSKWCMAGACRCEKINEVESLRAVRDELAAQAEGLRWQRYELMGVLVDMDNEKVFDAVCKDTISRVVSVLSQKTPAAAILRQRDARTLRMSAQVCREMTLYTGLDCADALNAMANELEKP